MDLTVKKCVACESGMPPLTAEQIKPYLDQAQGWSLVGIQKIYKEFKFRDFKEAMNFVNKVAAIAENEGHHPDFAILYNRVIINLTTHAVGGLSENDFIMAAKVDTLLQN